jgi:hypothetical protein
VEVPHRGGVAPWRCRTVVTHRGGAASWDHAAKEPWCHAIEEPWCGAVKESCPCR